MFSFKNRISFKHLARFFLLFLILPSGFSAAETSLTQRAWFEDLVAFEEGLKSKHIAFDHTLPSEALTRRLNVLRDKASDSSHWERVVELMRTVRLIGDGHTSIPLWDTPIRRYPFEATLVEDRVLITGTDIQYKLLLGSFLTEINGIPVSDIVSRLSKVVPFSENVYSTRVRVGQYFFVEELLAGLGVVEYGSPATLTFQKTDSYKAISVKAIERTDFAAIKMQQLKPRNASQYFDHEGKQSESLWFGSTEDRSTVYIQFNAYPSGDGMQEFSAGILRFVRKHKSENLIIDLRNNFGGDFFIGLLLASQLNLADSIKWTDGVYVLIGNRTFSAAMSNASQFRQILNARLVGEPTGGKPCGYQDMGQFQLPNSALVVTYSKRKFCFENSTQDAIHPDVTVPTPVSDYGSTSDSVLDWVITNINRRSTGTKNGVRERSNQRQ